MGEMTESTVVASLLFANDVLNSYPFVPPFRSVYGMSILGDDELIICDPKVFDKYVVRAEDKYPIGGAEAVTTFTDFYKENNLTKALEGTGHGPEWKAWRKSLDPDMYVAWETYLPTIADAANKISKVAGTSNIEFVDFLSRSAFDMFTAVMYGESPQTTNNNVASKEDIEFVRASQSAFDVTGRLLSNPLDKLFGGILQSEFNVNMEKTYYFANLRTKQYADGATELQRAAKTAHGEESESKCPITTIKTQFLNPSFIERLVHRGELSNDNIAELAAPLLMAGVDTTAYVMSWLYLNLASNLDVQAKLAEELKSVLDGADLTTKEQMDSLPYLKACIRESHRLTPATPILAKTLEKDIDVVVDDACYKVEAGHRISLNLRAIPMDPAYVDNPTLFQPERFLPSAVEARRGTPSEIIDHPSFADPFGRGKRRCLGVNVAVAEIMILAARLVQDWEIGLVDTEDRHRWTAKQKLMLKADPYPSMTVSPRS